MNNKHVHILLPQDLVREIDAIAGPRDRSAFLVEAARAAASCCDFLRSTNPPGRTAAILNWPGGPRK
jgi:hypothetical protein